MVEVRQLIIEGCEKQEDDKSKIPRNYNLVSTEVKPVEEKSEVKVEWPTATELVSQIFCVNVMSDSSPLLIWYLAQEIC